MIKLRKKTYVPVTIRAQLLDLGVRIDSPQGQYEIISIATHKSEDDLGNVKDIYYWITAENVKHRSITRSYIWHFDEQVEILVKIG